MSPRHLLSSADLTRPEVEAILTTAASMHDVQRREVDVYKRQVAISEAVNLAKDLSTDGSPAFVNGLLGRIAEVKDTVV